MPTLTSLTVNIPSPSHARPFRSKALFCLLHLGDRFWQVDSDGREMRGSLDQITEDNTASALTLLMRILLGGKRIAALWGHCLPHGWIHGEKTRPPAKSSVSELNWWTQWSLQLTANVLIAGSGEALSWDLPTKMLPDSWHLDPRIIHAYCFKSLSLGVIGYAARDNEYNTFNFILIITLSLDLPHDLLCQVYFFPGCLHLSAATGLVILKTCSLEVVSCWLRLLVPRSLSLP